MAEKTCNDPQEKFIETVERCIRRFDRIEKRLQQPWRNTPVHGESNPTHEIDKLRQLLNEIKGDHFSNERSKVILELMRSAAYTMETELRCQNTQKHLGEEVTPFGETELDVLSNSGSFQVP